MQYKYFWNLLLIGLGLEFETKQNALFCYVFSIYES